MLRSMLTPRSGHMQTMYSALADFTQVDKVEYDRYVLHSFI